MQDVLSDGIPLVVFTGQVATFAIGSGAFQEADVVGISRACTKWNVMDCPRRPAKGHYCGYPPDASAIQGHDAWHASRTPSNPLQPPEQSIDTFLIKQAADLINQAQRPIIYAGHGVLSSPLGPQLLKQLSQDGNIPVTTTLQSLRSFDELDEKSLHMLRMHGAAYANLAMQ
ncbi:Acetolactate synthase, mitochondrial [Grifola frondosa]|uniref:Acetolactate synthase, mitochondrial n=1 Tax=Grifola frondosa TaxID=5627 RepID=A0A1C7LN86_GRIFR|nr:Acetolactate synthase, mitochondrial [Grifola frondosa]